MFLSSEDVSQHIFNSSAPIFFIDTCIFLDILRSPYRENIHINAILSALNLIKMSEANPCKVWLLTNEMVHSEWIRNIVNEKQKLEQEVTKQEHIREQLVIAADVILKIKPAHGQKMTTLNLHDHLETLSNNLFKNCLLIKEEDCHHTRGSRRATKRLAPAKQGKQEINDCVIFETFLDISEKVRNRGYNGKIYFVTSNFHDYGKPNNPLIIEDLNRINATLIDNLPWALTIAEGRV